MLSVETNLSRYQYFIFSSAGAFNIPYSLNFKLKTWKLGLKKNVNVRNDSESTRSRLPERGPLQGHISIKGVMVRISYVNLTVPGFKIYSILVGTL